MDIAALLNIAFDRDALLAEALPRMGDRFQVRVLEVRADGKALVDCGRFRAVAEVTFPVTAGEELSVRVIDTRGTLRLEAVRPSSAPGVPAEAQPTEPAHALSPALLRDVRMQAGRLLSALPPVPAADEGPAGLRVALARVTALLQPLEPRPGGDLPERLQDYCRNSGLFLEARLASELAGDPAREAAARAPASAPLRRILAADLKAQLAALLHGLESGAPAAGSARESNELAQSARALLAEIVRQQGEITRTADESRHLTLIHFSLPLSAPQGAARLKIGYPRRRRKRPGDGHRAALLVELDRLGAVRADLHLAERQLSADLFVCRRELKPLVQEHVAELRDTLAPLFAEVRVTVRVSQRRVAEFEWEDLRPARAGRLDVRA